jgi:drug/metabolite transporter (DMT)-like permease
MSLASGPTGPSIPAVHRRAWVLIGVLAALWGASYMFIKVGLEDLSPVWVVFVRTALAAVVLVPLALSRGVLGSVRGAVGWVIVLGLVQMAAPLLLISLGEQHVSSSLAGILVSAAPIWTALIAMRFDAAETSRGWSLIGVLVGIAGVALLFGVDLTGGLEEILGGLAVLFASLGYAVGAMLVKHRVHGAAPLGIVACTTTIAAVAMVPLLPFSAPDHGPALDTVGAMLALGVGGTGLAFLIFYTLVGEVGPARASLVAYIAPGFSVAYGALILDEAIGVATIAGLALILVGSYLGAEGRLPWSSRPVVEPLGELGDPEAAAR